MSAFEVKLFPNPPRLMWSRERIAVRVKEFQVLEILLCEPGFVLGASSLCEKLRRGDRADAGPATSRSHVAHLRKAVRTVASDAVLLITEKAHGGSVYRLAIGADAVDAFRWERRALAARARLRAECTMEA